MYRLGEDGHRIPAKAGDQLLLSAETLAEQLELSVRTVWRLRSSGKLPKPIKVGGSVRWRSEEIDNWIAAGCPVPCGCEKAGR